MIVREYNKLIEDWLPIKAQKEHIKRYWGKRLIDIYRNKEDKRYLTYHVRIGGVYK